MAERRENERDRQEHENKQGHESSRSESSKERGGSEHRTDGSERGSEHRTDTSDLKQREYRDKEGNVHHHTHEYMERHGKEGGGGSDRS